MDELQGTHLEKGYSLTLKMENSDLFQRPFW